MTKPMISLSFIIILLSACNGAVTVESPTSTQVETPAPLVATATDTPLPVLPTFTPTNTLPPPEPAVSGFPYAAALNDALPKENLILAQHFYADTIGHLDDTICYDVGIYSDGSYIFISCRPDFTYPAPNGMLDANQSRYLNRWMEKFRSFEEPSIHGLLKFTGNGNAVPEYADQVSMQALIGDLEWDAHEYVHRGGYPSAVSHAREVLSHQLNKWLDNSNVLKFEAVDFPDSCLGAPKVDEVCEQVLTQGFYIQFVVDGMMYEFHTDVFGYEIRPFGEPRIAPTKGPVG
jgi:hypothetical protein